MSHPVEAGEAAARLRRYYTRYYRDTLRIPAWAELVESRIREEEQEAAHLARLQELLGRPVAGQRLLNLCCGTGGFSVVAAEAGARVVGVDAHPEAITICGLKGGRRSAGTFVHAVAERLPFKDGSFQLVYGFSALEHVACVPDSVGEIVRVTQPGGLIYLHMPNAWSCYEGHYKVAWIPFMPRWLGKIYLRLRGRPVEFLPTINYMTRRYCLRVLAANGVTDVHFFAGQMRPSGGRLWPLIRSYYRLFRITPFVELLARKPMRIA